jgi:hypothetical protein
MNNNWKKCPNIIIIHKDNQIEKIVIFSKDILGKDAQAEKPIQDVQLLDDR